MRSNGQEVSALGEVVKHRPAPHPGYHSSVHKNHDHDRKHLLPFLQAVKTQAPNRQQQDGQQKT